MQCKFFVFLWSSNRVNPGVNCKKLKSQQQVNEQIQPKTGTLSPSDKIQFYGL